MKILITGGTGSLGSVLTRKWHSEGNQITVISRNDHTQAAMRADLPGVVFHSLDIGNFGNFNRLLDICTGQDFCIHAGAQKVVSEAQYQPFAYLQTNILGTMYVLQAWKHTHSNCYNFLTVSTDKSISSLNFYGSSKAIAAALTRAEGYDGSAIRYGNVVTSRGSVFEMWRKQVDAGQPLEVRVGTPNKEAPTRFYLSMDNAVDLVEEAMLVMARGERGIFVPANLRAFDVFEVAEATGSKIEVKDIGGYEKLHEVLLAPGEGWRPVGATLGRVEAPYWPADSFYAPFRSNTAPRMTGAQVLEAVGWNR